MPTLQFKGETFVGLAKGNLSHAQQQLKITDIK